MKKEQQKYEKWWFGKYVSPSYQKKFKKVTGIELIGPPSFVYGDVWLTFEDGSEEPVRHGNAFKPRKMDLIALDKKPCDDCNGTGWCQNCNGSGVDPKLWCDCEQCSDKTGYPTGNCPYCEKGEQE